MVTHHQSKTDRQNCKEKRINLPLQLETSTPFCQKWADAASKKSVRITLNLVRWIQWLSTEDFVQQQNTHFINLTQNILPRQTTLSAIKHNKLLKRDIIQCLFSDHNGVKTESESESEVAQSCLTLCDPMDCSLLGFSVHGIPGKSTGVGFHFLLQGIFLTQGSNPGLLHCRQMLYPLRHQGILKQWKVQKYVVINKYHMTYSHL